MVKPKFKTQLQLFLRLKRQLLEDLKREGKTSLQVLYVRYGQEDNVVTVRLLEDLNKWDYIDVDVDNMVQITEKGLRLLEDEGYWKV